MFYGLLSKNFDQNTARVSILDYAQKNQFLVTDFLSDENNEILKITSPEDILIAPSISYLGLNLTKSLANIVSLAEKKIQIHFIDQPELSIYGDKFADKFATFKAMLESERAFLSARARLGMAASKAKGIKLGRPKGATQKVKALDNHKKEILDYMQKGISMVAIMKIINHSLEKKLSYLSFKWYIQNLRQSLVQ
jgi:DNA invertase Pin-like site-specific DNA recombinase